MKKLLLFFSICLCLNANLTMAQQIMAQPPENILPSEKTAQQLNEISAEIQRPELRYAPSEGGNANKESWIPIPDIDIHVIMVLASMLCIYVLLQVRGYKNIKHKQV